MVINEKPNHIDGGTDLIWQQKKLSIHLVKDQFFILQNDFSPTEVVYHFETI